LILPMVGEDHPLREYVEEDCGRTMTLNSSSPGGTNIVATENAVETDFNKFFQDLKQSITNLERRCGDRERKNGDLENRVTKLEGDNVKLKEILSDEIQAGLAGIEKGLSNHDPTDLAIFFLDVSH